MNRSEAEDHARRLQAEHADRDTHRFFARRAADGDWEVAKVKVPGQLRRTPLTPTIQATLRPSPADDPRSGHEQRAPGFVGGVG